MVSGHGSTEKMMTKQENGNEYGNTQGQEMARGRKVENMENNILVGTKIKWREWKLATWNVRGIRGKEMDLIGEFERYNIDVLGITETKKKGKGEQLMENGHIMVYGGVENDKHGAAGVGCLINKRWSQFVDHWEVYSERILLLRLKKSMNRMISILVVYGPNEDARVEEKDKFWEELNMAKENCKGKIIICGDINGRVGISQDNNGVVGKYGEDRKTNNGNRLIEYCRVNDLVVTNTFYEHKDIHKYTRQGPKREDRSIIDYILVERDSRREVNDVRVYRGAELGTDHYMLVARMVEEGEGEKVEKQNERCYERIKYYKLRERVNAEKYRTKLEEELTRVDVVNCNWTLEDLWVEFKTKVLATAKEVCGSVRVKGKTKYTSWWSEDIKKEIKCKKNRWKEYLRDRTEESYMRYKDKRKIVKEMIKRNKNKNWTDFGDKMEKYANENKKLFYRMLKNTRKKKGLEQITIRNKQGELLTDEKEIMVRWREYFIELLEGNDGYVMPEEAVGKDAGTNTDEDHISIEEINEALNRLKSGKSAGYDLIAPEMMKNMGNIGREIFRVICQKAWNEKEIPEDWRRALIVPIYKSGDKKECGNYRGITLMNTALKVYESILEQRLRAHEEKSLDEAQSGFIKGRSTQDHIFTIKQIIEKVRKNKRTAYFVFIDLVKAFDKVRRKKLWEILEKRGVDSGLLQSIQSIYKKNVNFVIRQNMRSAEFETRDGLRQGGTLSPLLFIIFLDEIIKECKENMSKLFIGHWRMERIEISECAFADDVVLMSGSKRGIQKNVDMWYETLKKYGMEINRKKTKIMRISDEEDEVRVEIEEEVIQQVEQFTYLGVSIDKRGNQEGELNDRIEKTSKLYHAMNNNFIRKREIAEKTKMMVYKTVIRPVLTYGCETWTTTLREKSRLQAMEMKILRGIKGVTRRDRWRNEEVRRQLRVESLNDYIGERQLGWWGHLQRMEINRQVRRIWEAKVETKPRRGRPHLTWMDSVKKEVNRRRKSVEEAKVLAMDRKHWKEFIKSVYSDNN